jgi:cytosine/uracil/thiamine/allantoin permease
MDILCETEQVLSIKRQQMIEYMVNWLSVLKVGYIKPEETRNLELSEGPMIPW